MRIFVGRNKFKFNEERIWKVANGYSQVCSYSRSLIVNLWRYLDTMDSDCLRHRCSIINTLDRPLVGQGEKTREIIMGAIAMFILLILISLVGLVYFTIQDRKEKEHKLSAR